jgi:diadenosine tetraphosphate (Ap4A) HIT family hydrolase
MESGLDGATPPPEASCPFCLRAALDIVLEETPHFYLLVDHAPLTEGHLLIVPQAHYACYGATPAALDAELLELKRRVHSFLTARYGPIVFFEHGVFRQTVYHAHLHAIPIDATHFDIPDLAAPAGALVRAQADVRAWYAQRGHYFYLERPADGERDALAALFPPEMERYWQVLGRLREAASRRGEWQPQPMRRALGGAMMRSVADSWRAQRDA